MKEWDLYNTSLETVKINYQVFVHCTLSKAALQNLVTTGALLLVIVGGEIQFRINCQLHISLETSVILITSLVSGLELNTQNAKDLLSF